VKCSNESGDSGYSDVLEVTTPVTPTLPAPTNFKVVSVSSIRVELSWSYPAGATIKDCILERNVEGL